MPKTYVTTSRFAIEDIATIAAFMEQNGKRVLNRSAPVTDGIEMMANLIRDNHPSLTFNVVDAVKFIRGLGIDPAKSNRGAKELAKQLQCFELGGYLPKEEYDMNVPETEQECILSEEDKTMIQERRKKELEESLKSFKQVSGLDVEE